MAASLLPLATSAPLNEFTLVSDLWLFCSTDHSVDADQVHG